MMNVTGEKRNNRRKSFIMVESFSDLISNSSKRSFLNDLRGILVRWFFENYGLQSSFDNLISEKEGLDSISRKILDWCWNRHNSLLRAIKFENLKITQNMLDLLTGYNYVILSEEADQQGLVNDEADEGVWLNFAVKIRGSKTPFPSKLDADYYLIIREVRESAYEYYYDALDEALNDMIPQDLCDVLYYITNFPSAYNLIDMILTRVLERCSSDVIKTDVTPKFVLLCCISPQDHASGLLDFFLTRIGYVVDVNTINAAIEFASYNLNSSCYELLLRRETNALITIEGIICSALGIILVGNSQLLSIIIALVTEKIREALFMLNQKETSNNQKETSNNQKETSNNQSEKIEDWTLYLAPFIYVFFLAALEGTGKEAMIPEIFGVYQDQFKGLLASHMEPILPHSKFTAAVFQKACDSNFPHVVDLLLQYQWAPADLTHSLLRAAEKRYQKLFSTMLFSLLSPDPKVKCMAGAVPKVFSKTRVLRALPSLGKTFPMEVSSFLEQLSYIPVPICIPINKETDAFCKTKLVRGLKLGCGRLDDVLNRPQLGTPNDFIWDNLTFEGTLRKSAPRKNDTNQEVDSVVCMVPLCLVTDSALHETTQSKSHFRQTNPLIRLLELNDEDITLQPLSQVLVEFHWAQAKLWRRVVLKFLFLFSFFGCMIATFILVAEKQTKQNAGYVYPMGWTTFCLSILLLGQEFRQMTNGGLGEYFTSIGNVFDLAIHSIVLYVIISGIFLDNNVPILLMSITIVVGAVRSLSQIGIIPSIGPLYRSWEMAFVNVVPLAIPMGTMILAYSFAVYVAEHGKETEHFRTLYDSIQTCLEMATWNYGGLDNVSNPEIFTLKVLFHTTFIVFFVNLIVAIMTVNLAECFSDANDAFFLQISSVMVELELFWFFPSEYRLMFHNDLEDGIEDLEHPSNVNKRWSDRKSIKKTFPLLTDAEKSLNVSAATNNDDSLILLYSCPIEKVKDSTWWNDFPRKSRKENKAPGNLDPMRIERPKVIETSEALERIPTKFRKKSPNNNNLFEMAKDKSDLYKLREKRDSYKPNINNLQGSKNSLLDLMEKAESFDRPPIRRHRSKSKVSYKNVSLGRRMSSLKPEISTSSFNEGTSSMDAYVNNFIEKLNNNAENQQRLYSESEGRIMNDIQELKHQVSRLAEALKSLNEAQIPGTVTSTEEEGHKVVTISDME